MYDSPETYASFHQGCMAFLDGVVLDKNPYPDPSKEYNLWYDGWMWEWERKNG